MIYLILVALILLAAILSAGPLFRDHIRRQVRRRVVDRAKARMERARELVPTTLSSEGLKYFKNRAEAANFYDWVMTPELDEMSKTEFEYKEHKQ